MCKQKNYDRDRMFQRGAINLFTKETHKQTAITGISSHNLHSAARRMLMYV